MREERYVRSVATLACALSIGLVVAGVIVYSTIDKDIDNLDYFQFGVGKTLLVIGGFLFVVGALLCAVLIREHMPGSATDKAFANLRLAAAGNILFGIGAIVFDALVLDGQGFFHDEFAQVTSANADTAYPVALAFSVAAFLVGWFGSAIAGRTQRGNGAVRAHSVLAAFVALFGVVALVYLAINIPPRSKPIAERELNDSFHTAAFSFGFGQLCSLCVEIVKSEQARALPADNNAA